MPTKKPTTRAATTKETTNKIFTKTPRPKKSVKAGLKEGETRVTCVLTDDQSQVLHDWAKTNGRTFREVTMAMADRYIEEVIKQYVEAGHKLRRQAGVEPPESYADFYEDDNRDDMLDQFDSFAR